MVVNAIEIAILDNDTACRIQFDDLQANFTILWQTGGNSFFFISDLHEFKGQWGHIRSRVSTSLRVLVIIVAYQMENNNNNVGPLALNYRKERLPFLKHPSWNSVKPNAAIHNNFTHSAHMEVFNDLDPARLQHTPCSFLELMQLISFYLA